MQEDDIPTDVPAAAGEPAESKPSEAVAEESTEATTETETDPSEAEPDGESDDTEEDKPKKPSRYDRLKRKVERLEGELAQTRSGQVPTGQDADEHIRRTVEAEIGAPPQEKDYTDYLAFERALTAYEVDRRQAERAARRGLQTQQQGQQEQLHELVDTFMERKADIAKRIPDLEAKLAKATHPVSPTVERLILESEKGPLIAYHFADRPKELAALNAMGPVAAAKEIGRLEVRLSLPKPNTATKAPAPAAPLSGGASAASSPSRDLDAWMKKTYGR